MNIGIVAIHGGEIEPGTEDIAIGIALDFFPLYINQKGPHVKSIEFTNSEMEEFLKSVDLVVSVHGEADMEKSFVMLGGLMNELVEKIKDSLNKNGFVVKEPEDSLNGDNPRNVCNRGLSGKGVQIEISRKLRNELMNDEMLFRKFTKSVKDCLF